VISTHGHIDHTSGIMVIDQEADARGISRPRIIAHRDVRRRMDRYEASHGFNSIVQGQQFNTPGYVYPVGQRQPDEVYDDTLSVTIGGEQIELTHGRGETDDATFVWLPRRRVLASGDFVIFLNDDTLPQHGWLAPLLRIFREHEDAGAAGGRLGAA